MKIIPEIGTLTEPYWQATREERLIAQLCNACGRLQHPPMPRCGACASDDLGWKELSGTGKIYAYTVVEHPAHFAFADRVPYATGVVELDEGVKIVTDFPFPLEDIKIGLLVRVRFDRVDDEVTLPRFVPASDSEKSR